MTSRLFRDFIGKVKVSFGEVLLYTPSLESLDNIDCPVTDSKYQYHFVAAALLISYEEFLEWPVTDGMLVINYLNDHLK